jgi:autotransporter-associated beta strand protein
VNDGLALNGLTAVTLGELVGSGNFDFGAATFTVGDNGTNFLYQGNLHGGGTLVKRGSNAMIMSGANNFVGVANINAGAVTVNGGLQGLGVIVNLGGTLMGVGTIAGGIVVNSGGILAPGDSYGILSAQSLFMTSGALFNVEIGGTSRGVDFDALTATGSVSLAGTMSISLVGGFAPALGSHFDVLDRGSALWHFFVNQSSHAGRRARLEHKPAVYHRRAERHPRRRL